MNTTNSSPDYIFHIHILRMRKRGLVNIIIRLYVTQQEESLRPQLYTPLIPAQLSTFPKRRYTHLKCRLRQSTRSIPSINPILIIIFYKPFNTRRLPTTRPLPIQIGIGRLIALLRYR